MELTLHGLDVYTAEVDDKGIDFIVRKDNHTYFDIQVKSSRNLSYVFFRKEKFPLGENLYAALVLFSDGTSPELYPIPSLAWRMPNELLVDKDYIGLQSPPEYGINLSKKNLPLLAPYIFEDAVIALRD
jgi:hypothetical protein